MRVGRGNYKRDIDVGKSFKALGVPTPQALVSFHSFTVCDETGKFNDYAKQYCGNTFITSSKKVIDVSLLLGNSNKHPTEECINEVTLFMLNLYSKNCPTYGTKYSRMDQVKFVEDSL